MNQIRQLDGLIESWPPAIRIAVAAGLVLFSLISIYGRINLEFGSKAFSRIPKSDIRSNWEHIISYTVIPIVVTLGYLYLLTTK